MEYIKSAFSSIKQNKGRTLLTMLGIIIGISSVITILSIGDGMKSYVNSSLDEISQGGITINIDAKKTDRYLEPEDLQKIKEVIPEVLGITMSIDSAGTYNDGQQDRNMGVYGGTADISRDEKNGMYSGRFFRDDEAEAGSQVCVLTQADAMLLFGTDDVIDRTFTLDMGSKSADMTIIGVLKSEENDILAARDAIRRKEQAYYYCGVYVP